MGSRSRTWATAAVTTSRAAGKVIGGYFTGGIAAGNIGQAAANGNVWRYKKGLDCSVPRAQYAMKTYIPAS